MKAVELPDTHQTINMARQFYKKHQLLLMLEYHVVPTLTARKIKINYNNELHVSIPFVPAGFLFG